jgi:hypothetical protein
MRKTFLVEGGKKVAYNFHPVDRDQMYLMPPTLKEWLPDGDLAWFLLDAVREMDLEVFLGRYREDGTGSRAYHPEMMVGLLLYAYCQGAYFGAKRPVVSEESGHPFRSKAATCFGPIRPYLAVSLLS